MENIAKLLLAFEDCNDRDRSFNFSIAVNFLGAKLEVNSSRWRGVPIIMVAGKKLDERTSYARILFKKKIFSAACTHGKKKV